MRMVIGNMKVNGKMVNQMIKRIIINIEAEYFSRD